MPKSGRYQHFGKNEMDTPAYLSIIIPLYNEEESVEKLVSKITDVGRQFDFRYEIMLVDDGSTDATWQTIERLTAEVLQVRGIKLRRNFGQTSAMVAGFESAAGEIIVTMDGDLQNDPSDIPKLLSKMQEGFDIVSGWRKERKDHFSRVLPSRIANYIISITTGVRLHDYGCSLKAYRSEAIKSIRAYGDMHRFFPALASMTGARVTEMPVNHYPRRHGKSKYGFDRILKVFSDIFSMNLIIRFSSMPLTGFTFSALPFLALMFFFGGLSLAAFLFDWTGQKVSFFLLAAVISGMAVAHLVFLGIIGELVVGMSNGTRIEMPEVMKEKIDVRSIGTNANQKEHSS
jgi:glycosyltransferase involved in cell wall biosynthesis